MATGVFTLYNIRAVIDFITTQKSMFQLSTGYILALFCISVLTSGFKADKPPENDTQERTILAIFAHPDDEFMVSPILSKFAERGDKVHIAIATDGRYGASAHAGIPAGDSLATVRAKEIQCSAKAMGAEPPALFDLHDGFAHKQPDLGNTLEDFRKLHEKVVALIQKLQPDAVITWDPSGGYGHPDHRTVNNIVTEVFQSRNFSWPTTLLYTGFSSDRFDSLPEFSQPVIKWFIDLWHLTDPEYLDIQISYDENDLQKARKALGCHKSQFTTADMDELIELLDHIYNGKVTLRTWSGDSGKAKRLLE
jgi:LmbE family N-acetylglucosaminyl deacetylase